MEKKISVISGRVLSADGQPIAGARVFFVSSPVPVPDIALLTDGTGRFSLTAPVPGAYRIGCSSDEFGSATITVDVPEGQNVEVEIRLG
jgi:Carboxypeptidase regulatory-like domain